MTAPIQIEAVVDVAEQPALVAAAEQLNEALTDASGESWPIRLRFHSTLAALAAQNDSTVLVASLLPELARLDEPWPSVEARWRAQAAELVDGGASTVLLCTIFRRVVDRSTRALLIERIRRLNLLAIELSHDFGLAVADIDRVFAHIGGRAVQSDYRLGGAIAAEVAGYVVARGVLSVGLDDVVPAEIQEQGRAFLGGLMDINTLVNRRLKRPR